VNFEERPNFFDNTEGKNWKNEKEKEDHQAGSIMQLRQEGGGRKRGPSGREKKEKKKSDQASLSVGPIFADKKRGGQGASPRILTKKLEGKKEEESKKFPFHC